MSSERRAVARGLLWNSAFQVFQILISFISMTVLARVIAPVEYGRATAAIGFLVFVNAWNCGAFMAQALQLPADREPDWRQHFAAGLYVQAPLAAATALLGLALRASPAHRSLTGLLLVAALGMIIDWPCQLRQVMLRRTLDFRRLRILSMLSLIANVGTTIGGAFLGWGAYAIVLGGNVVTTVPFVVELFVVARFSPGRNWWRWPGRVGYRDALGFGSVQALSAMLISVRMLAASAVLPEAIGLTALGLWSRALALYQSSGGRGLSIVIDTIYPLMPRVAADPLKFARYAALLVSVALWATVPIMVLLTLEGASLSRLIYGNKWIAADFLIAPATIVGVLLSIGTVTNSVLLAANRLRVQLLVEVVGTALVAPAIVAALLARDTLVYAWVAAAGQALTALVAVLAIRPLVQRGWWRTAVVPAALIGALCLLALRGLSLLAWWPALSAPWRVLLAATAAGVTTVATLRLGYGRVLADVLGFVHGGQRLRRWLRL